MSEGLSLFLATVHLHPAWTLPIGAAASAWIVWYWVRLGQPNVPVSRRNIRRTSLAFMIAALAAIVVGLSFVDRVAQPRQYVIVWTAAMLIVFIVIATAGLDAMNNLRLLQRQAHEAATASAQELVHALQRRRA